ncbi:P-loop NTPase [Haloarcula salina]|uniref:P-loop NTPase n=1 Tax=Haloarcula salina TaxID=1429914 RepID=A0AA41KI90_9EURY|nr:P-loop NTPase [Haloarcula salina]MBV0901448.1 P-loop NTPase [Haloarcula salina]
MVTNHVYTVAGAKGGVGKTTTSINLGTMLAEAGYSTVVVEMDLAMANVVDFLDMDLDTDEATTFHDVLAGDAPIADAMYETEVGLSVVPSGTTLDGYAATDLDRLPDIVEDLRWHHDVVLLDTPAGLSEETIRPLQLADDVLLVSTPRVSSIRNVGNTQELADRVDAPVRGLVLTKSGTGASPGADQIADFLGVELLGHVPEDDAVPHAQDGGAPVVLDAPKSGAAVAYRKIARQLVETEKASSGDATVHEEADDAGSGSEPSGAGPIRHGEAAADSATDGGRVQSSEFDDDSDLLGPSPPGSADAAPEQPTEDAPTEPTDGAPGDVAGESEPGTVEDSKEDAEPSRGATGTAGDDGPDAVTDADRAVATAGQHGTATDAGRDDRDGATDTDEGETAAEDDGGSRSDATPRRSGDETDSASATDAAAADEERGSENDGSSDGLGTKVRSLFGL